MNATRGVAKIKHADGHGDVPVVRDRAMVDLLLDELLAANAPFVESAVGGTGRRTVAGRM